jgi:hypothetical protein
MQWMIEAVTVRKLLRCLLGAVTLWAVSCAAGAAQSAGVVKTLSGQATITRESASLPVAPGQRLFAGDRISAGAGSYVGVTLHDDTRLAIGPGSELLIREFEFNPSSYAGGLAISFLRGTARVITGIIAKHAPERVNFNTPTMTIGIRGTDFIVDLEPQP